MNISLNFSERLIAEKYYSLAILIGVASIGGVVAFPLTYVVKINFLLGLCLFPFVLFVKRGQRLNLAYLVLMFFFGITAYVYNVRIFYFFTLAFYIIFLLELSIGKVSSLVLFLIAFMSPFFEQVEVIIGFPLRLQLSQWAGSLLSFAGSNIQVEGNMMTMNGATFAVDDACMGLNLLSTSLLIGVFMIAHWYSSIKLQLNFLMLLVFFAVVFLFNVITNLLRILILVAFQVLPEDPMHEIIGILCLVVYVIAPLYFLSRWMVNRFGKQYAKSSKGTIALNIVFLGLIMSCAVLWLGIHIHQQRLRVSQGHADVHLQGMRSINMQDGITKLYDDKILIYVKPIPEFFTGEHTPLICWQGSGYVFQGVKKAMISGNEMYYGELIKEKSKLFTAWWYSNGKVQTINQLDWRMRMFKGEEKFSLINVTASDAVSLNENIKMIFEKNLLSIKNTH